MSQAMEVPMQQGRAPGHGIEAQIIQDGKDL